MMINIEERNNLKKKSLITLGNRETPAPPARRHQNLPAWHYPAHRLLHTHAHLPSPSHGMWPADIPPRVRRIHPQTCIYTSETQADRTVRIHTHTRTHAVCCSGTPLSLSFSPSLSLSCTCTGSDNEPITDVCVLAAAEGRTEPRTADVSVFTRRLHPRRRSTGREWERRSRFNRVKRWGDGAVW